MEVAILQDKIRVGGRSKVVSDGAFQMMLVEFGVPLFSLYLIIFFSTIIYLFKWLISIELYLYKFFLAFFSVVFFANFINSAFYNKFVYSLYWLISNISWRLYQNTKK